MNDNQQNEGGSSDSGSSAALGFVLGAVIGAGIALLLAPHSGEKTRRRIANAGRRWSGAARSGLDQALETVDDFKHDAKSALDAGREAFENGRHSESRPPADVGSKR